MLKILQALIKVFIDDMSSHPDELIGLILYLFGCSTIIIIQVVYKKQWDKGSVGFNGLWDLPEIIMTESRWYFPFIVMAACFLPTIVKPPDMAWWFMMGVTFFSLTGRWGLEWLERMKGTVSSVFTKKTETKIETNEQQSEVDTTSSNTTGGK